MAKKVKASKKVMVTKVGTLELKEKMFTALMGEEDDSPSEFVIALCNASTHGNIFVNNGHSLASDDALEVWHDCLDVMLLCARIIEGDSIGNYTDEQLDEMKRRLKKYKTLFDFAQ